MGFVGVVLDARLEVLSWCGGAAFRLIMFVVVVCSGRVRGRIAWIGDEASGAV